MKLATYENYKPSGVLWLGQVPDHWDVWKVAHGFQQTGSGTTPPSDNQEWYDGDICWVTTSELREQFIFDTEKKISSEALESFSALKVFPKGSLAVAMYGATIGRLGIFGVEAATNQACCVLYGEKAFDTRFTFYWLQVFREQVILLASGGGQPNISQEKVRSIRIACPPIEEQQTITRFLDAKTAQIDTLVAKKRQLIDKLKEKRSALIARTVTRGLPPEAAKAAGLAPNPEMKDSGVEWLGAIPAHWTAVQLRRHVRFITSGSRGWAEHYADTGSIFVRIGNLTRDSLNVDLSDIQYVAPPPGTEGVRTKIKVGDLLFSITAYLGSIAVAPESLQDAFVSQHVALVRLMPNSFMPRYAGYCVLADAGQAQLNEQGYGGTKIQLSLDDVKALWLPQPPAEEQQAIAAYLDHETAHIDQLIIKVEAVIARLTEYRQALIISAVTGKIDVRAAANLETEMV